MICGEVTEKKNLSKAICFRLRKLFFIPSKKVWKKLLDETVANCLSASFTIFVATFV